jgi:hypothetical protein
MKTQNAKQLNSNRAISTLHQAQHSPNIPQLIMTALSAAPRAPMKLKSDNKSRGVSSRQNQSRWLVGGKACLDVRRLEHLVCIDLPNLLHQPSPTEFVGLTARYKSSSDHDDSGLLSSTVSIISISSELDHVAFYLMHLVNHAVLARHIPPTLLSEIHSFCGMIHDMNHDTQLAMQSHLRAVWLARKQTNCNKDQVQVSTSRLVMLYNFCKRQDKQLQ